MWESNSNAQEKMNFIPVKGVLEDMEGLLKELRNELNSIENAIFVPEYDGQCSITDIHDAPPVDDRILPTLIRQRDTVRDIFETVLRIRQLVW